MKAGKLDRRITIQIDANSVPVDSLLLQNGDAVLTEADDQFALERDLPTNTGVNAIGERVDQWADYVTLWAGFRPGSGREFMSPGGGERVAEAQAVFTVRYRNDITTQMRIVHDAKTYNIQAVSEYGRRLGLELMAVEHRA